MVEQSTFRGTIEFFGDIGIYDVVLPFLLIFTIVFAILEKTKILGTEQVEGLAGLHTKKNLNSIVSFVIAFLVVASSRLVAIVNEVASNFVILLMLSILFLLLIGSFHKEEAEGFFLQGWTKSAFMAIMFVGIILIFLHAVRTEDGQPWLFWGWGWLVGNWSSNAAASIILVLITIGAILYVTKERRNPTKEKEKT